MTAATAAVGRDEQAVGLWRDAWRRLVRNPAAIIGGVIVGFFVLVAIFAPLIATHDPIRGNLANSYVAPMEQGHFFGTNVQGQDVFSRIVFGTRLTLGIAVLSVALGVAAGAVLGALAGFFPGWIDAAIMRSVDVMLSIPGLLLAIAVVSWLGRGVVQVAIAIALINIPIFARILRGSLLALREADYVTAARSVGVRGPTLLLRHMMPNALGPLIVQATLALATAVVDAAALGFLGLGPPDPRTPEWGAMLSDTYRHLSRAPYLA
ncbi:MAG TPA: ABC transporter permease, partial [Candidatus Caenarcaniphilales bacterium]|nr:ABC transporter permease [Candidatus Caenarcaniphilales bacterium]